MAPDCCCCTIRMKKPIVLVLCSIVQMIYSVVVMADIVNNRAGIICNQSAALNETVVISSVVDLKGDIIDFPANSILRFEDSGKFINGHVIFNSNHIKQKNKGSF